MSTMGIGSSYSYVYNTYTKKLTSKTGNEDNFVNYFNGELADDESAQELNGFDYNKKRDMKNMLMMFEAGLMNNPYFKENEAGEIEIMSEVVDAVTSDYSANGKKVFTAHNSVLYTSDEIKSFSTISQPYKEHASQPYNPEDNSIGIAVGDMFDLGNGYKLTIKGDYILAEGYENGTGNKADRTNHLVGGLNSLLHFAGQQWFSSMIHEEDTPELLQFLKQLGVDTSKEFTVNGTKCEVVDGRIREVGNVSVVPSSIYEQAVKRYEENLYKPLDKEYL